MPDDNDHDRFIILRERNWRDLKARVAALETSQRLLVKQIASMHAAVLYPDDLEARVKAFRKKYKELLTLLGLGPKEQKG